MITEKEDNGGFAMLSEARARIMDFLTPHARETLGGASGFLRETMEYALSTPGKLLRPLLLLDACRAVGGDPELVFPAAAGTEYGHIASLVHDDIMDSDDERRGQPTLHARFDVASAILTGDSLIFQTFLSYTQCLDKGVSADRVLDAIRTLSGTCIEMCRGQALEASIAADLDITEDMYLEMIRLKTASFSRAAAQIGASLGGGQEDAVLALADYGNDLGMAFQIIDDVLSYDGDSLVLGKPTNSDVRNRRVTLPIIYAMRSEKPEERREINEAFRCELSDSAEAYSTLVRLLHSTRALDRARAVAYHYTARAHRHLDTLPCSEARERLHRLADTFLSREH